MNVMMVTCDTGFLPDWVTLVLYLIVFILIHYFLIGPFFRRKKNINLGIRIVAYFIILLSMIVIYPEIASHNCPHLFWRIFGIDTL